jgi:N utilization substance protein B
MNNKTDSEQGSMKVLTRSGARELAFQSLYANDTGENRNSITFERIVEANGYQGTNLIFARKLVEGVSNHLLEINDKISEFATAFPLGDMPPVDRAILRLAVYELLFDTLESENTPERVAINEAVNMAKKFGAESSGRFVNGVLGGIVRKQQQNT